MIWERVRILSIAVILAFIWSPIMVGEEPIAYESATFTYSNDPTKVVLYVRHAGGMAGTHRSMTLHGDGRLVLKNGTGPHITEEYTQQLDFSEVQHILRLAVDHGLAEWDGTRLLAQQYDLNNGKAFSTPTDNLGALILLSINDYQRGAYRLNQVERRIQLYAAEYLDRNYPRIPEIHGVVELTRLLKKKLQEATAAAEQP